MGVGLALCSKDGCHSLLLRGFWLKFFFAKKGPWQDQTQTELILFPQYQTQSRVPHPLSTP